MRRLIFIQGSNSDPVGGPMADFVLDEPWSYRFGADEVHDWGARTDSNPVEQVPGVYGYTPIPGLTKTGNPHVYTLMQGWIADETITQEDYDTFYKAFYEDPFRPKIVGSPSRQGIPLLSEALSFDVYDIPDAINDPTTNTVTTYTKSFKFRITSGEWPTGTPLPDEFLPEHTDQLLNVEAAGARSQLEVTARNVEIQFPATSTPKHRIFIVPADTYFYGVSVDSGGSGGITFNKVYDSDGVDVPLVAGALGLAGRPYTGRYGFTGYSNEFHVIDYRGTTSVGYAASPLSFPEVVPYYVFVTEARSDAFSIFLRCEVLSAVQSFGSSYATNNISTSFSATQLPVTTGELRNADVLFYQHAWRFTASLENTDAASHTITIDRVNDVEVTFAPDSSTLATSTLSRSNTVFFAAYDGVTDGLGASGYQQPLDIKTNTPSTTTSIGPSDSRFSSFVGTGSVSFGFTSTATFTVTGTPSYSGGFGTNQSFVSLTLQYTYWKP